MLILYLTKSVKREKNTVAAKEENHIWRCPKDTKKNHEMLKQFIVNENHWQQAAKQQWTYDESMWLVHQCEKYNFALERNRQKVMQKYTNSFNECEKNCGDHKKVA